MRFIKFVAAAVIAFAAMPAAAKDSELFILGALHGLHEQEESFGYDELGRVVAAIKPDVLLLEVTPEELAGKLETKGRPEYPKIIWPMLSATGIRAYPMEAGQPLYAEITGEASAKWGAFGKQFPTEESTLSAHAQATSNVLLAHWKSVADTQDEATDALARARSRLNAAMVAGSDPSQRQWDGVMVDTARQAIRDNPGKRILLLGSYRNRYMFVDELRAAEGAKLVDMKAWLESNGFGRKAN